MEELCTGKAGGAGGTGWRALLDQWFSNIRLASQGVLVVKNLPPNAGDLRDAGSIPDSGGSFEEGMATHSSIPAWEAPWTEEPGGLQPMGSQSRTRMSTLNRTGDPQGGLLKHRLLSPTAGV